MSQTQKSVLSGTSCELGDILTMVDKRTLTGAPLHPSVDGFAKAAREGRMSRREFLAQATALGVTATAAYGMLGLAAPEAKAAAHAKKGGRLRVSMLIKANFTDARIFDWSELGNAARHFLEPLVRWTPDFTFTPYLLSGWTANGDATQYVLTVREGVKWNNGEALTASHVAWNIERWAEADVDGNSMAARVASLVDSDTNKATAGSIVADDAAGTVTLNLNKPDIAIIAGMADYPALIQYPGSSVMDGIGTGPFRMTNYEPEVGASYDRNDDHAWWGGEVYLDGIDYIDYGTDPAAVVGAFEAGEIHANFETQAEQVDTVDDLGFQRHEVATGATIVVRMHTDTAPYDNKALRQAIVKAVSNEDLLALGNNGLGLVAENHHVGPVHEEYAKLPPISRDLDAAKKEIADLGFAGTTLDLYSLDADYRLLTTDAVGAQLEEAGLNINRIVMPGSTFWTNWTTHPFSSTNWNGRPLGTQVLSLAYRSGVKWNETAYANPEFDALLDKAEATADVEARRAIMAKIEAIMQDDAIMIQPYWRSLFSHTTPEVQGYRMHQAYEHHFEGVWLDA